MGDQLSGGVSVGRERNIDQQQNNYLGEVGHGPLDEFVKQLAQRYRQQQAQRDLGYGGSGYGLAAPGPAGQTGRPPVRPPSGRIRDRATRTLRLAELRPARRGSPGGAPGSHTVRPCRPAVPEASRWRRWSRWRQRGRLRAGQRGASALPQPDRRRRWNRRSRGLLRAERLHGNEVRRADARRWPLPEPTAGSRTTSRPTRSGGSADALDQTGDPRTSSTATSRAVSAGRRAANAPTTRTRSTGATGTSRTIRTLRWTERSWTTPGRSCRTPARPASTAFPTATSTTLTAA